MELTELYSQLSFGELSNLSLSNNGDGTIVEEKKPQIVGFANEALLRLYTRFVLKQNDLILEMRPNTTFYHLLSRYAEQSWDETSEIAYPYIRDLAREKFTEDVLRITAVYDNNGNERPLDDRERYDSIFVPQPNTIQNPTPKVGEFLNVMYQAKHPKLDTETVTTIELPDVLHEAFKAYIAYKVTGSMNTNEMQGVSQGHFGMYENICQELIDRDILGQTQTSTNVKFRKRGWK